MPTLHLIDADSTQACPAVMATVRQFLAKGDAGDRLLLLGGQPLEAMAKHVGIENTHRITPRFGHTRLAVRTIKRWLNTQPRFDQVHCWSLDALLAAGFLFTNTPMQMSCIHTLDPANLKRLRKFIKSPWSHPVRVVTHRRAWYDQLINGGIKAHVESAWLPSNAAPPPPSPSRAELRKGWGASETNHRVVALLSDHPSQTNALDAAAITCLAGASLTNPDGQRLAIKLLIHPAQRNRQRAQYFLADQSDYHRVVQDVRTAEPWDILSGCDAALALGPDAEELSLQWAINAGIPVIFADAEKIDPSHSNQPHLHVAPSSEHKDAAHLLHQALNESTVAQTL